VVDPDPYVSVPPGSGSVIICTDPDLDPDPNNHQAKNVRKLSTVCNFFKTFYL
jgi:hypothetical protein